MRKICGLPLRVDAKAICPKPPPNDVGIGEKVVVGVIVGDGRKKGKVLVGVTMLVLVEGGAPVVIKERVLELEIAGAIIFNSACEIGLHKNTMSNTTEMNARMKKDKKIQFPEYRVFLLGGLVG